MTNLGGFMGINSCVKIRKSLVCLELEVNCFSKVLSNSNSWFGFMVRMAKRREVKRMWEVRNLLEKIRGMPRKR